MLAATDVAGEQRSCCRHQNVRSPAVFTLLTWNVGPTRLRTWPRLKRIFNSACMPLLRPSTRATFSEPLRRSVGARGAWNAKISYKHYAHYTNQQCHDIVRWQAHWHAANNIWQHELPSQRENSSSTRRLSTATPHHNAICVPLSSTEHMRQSLEPSFSFG